MKTPDCGYEAQIVEAARRGIMDQALILHLAACRNCCEVAAIIEHIESRGAGVEPGSGLADEGERLWQVSRSVLPSSRAQSIRRQFLLLRGSSIVAPFALAILIWRDRLLPSELLSGTATMLRTGLACLPVDAGVAFAGALFLVTALAVLRFALSD